MSFLTERKKGIQIHRSIVYGSHARLLSPSEAELAPPGHTHRWTVFLQSATTPPPRLKKGKGKGVARPEDVVEEDEDFITGGQDDLSWLIKRITFRLHETYPSPNRAVDKPPYRITETGWGEFPLNIRVQFQPETGEKTITFVHNLKLHHWGPVLTGPLQNAERPEGSNREVETPLPESTGTPGVETIGNSRAGTELDDSVRIEVETEAGTEGTPRPAGSEGVGDVEMQDSETAEAKEETDDAGERNRSESVVPKSEIMMARPIDPPASDPTNPSGQPAINPLPVHSWQYDQFVFTDPTHQFYQLLIAHPETPLPEQSIRKGQSEGEGAVLGVDRGSAGVPLEFTKELERGEWEMMENGRKGLIEEMDRWRQKLIELETEAQQLKDEIAAVTAAGIVVPAPTPAPVANATSTAAS